MARARKAVLVVENENEGIVALDIQSKLDAMGHMDNPAGGRVRRRRRRAADRRDLQIPVPHLTAHADEHTLERAKAARACGGDPSPLIRIDVTDSGVGMDGETQQHIFGPLHDQEQRRSRGLGLAAVYGIVRDDDGWIDCKSALAQGTTMSV